MCGRRRIGEQQAGVEISRLRHPGIAAPAAPRGLPRRRDPQGTALPCPAARERLRVGRAEGVVSNQTDAGTLSVGMKLHQNSDFAAAAAAATSGAGQAMNNIISTPLTPSTTLRAPGIGSNGAIGSSKYITLTIER